ncbi:hypothetical protein FE784_22150 [Paenibacillus hemerocallicola]|uniref:DUF262 domain-containing protein n=1 Tax=Paenibacillus hemerocallicola TaxID=1172614 RepID=A0A5C4T4L8_9BACL|nr:DUF262 domain-containing protein [Paenibacillus hemerocallicola]TNJ64018.1 hypothetical protein FE784_22150 [Paenibacillus hemerocallicola]
MPKAKGDEGDNRLISIPESERRVMMETRQLPLFELYRYQDWDRLFLNPAFSLSRRWSLTKKSRVIESTLVSIPLPPVYVAEMRSGPLVVVDGHHRLRSLFDFLAGRYRLTGLTLMSHLNGSTFDTLEASIRRKIEDYYITVHTITQETHPHILYELVRRIHEGSEKLKPGQFRVLLLEERVQRLLLDYSKDGHFSEAIRGKIPGTYAMDTILRFFAFAEMGFYHYAGDLNRYVEEYIERYSHLLASDGTWEMFRDSMELMARLYGETRVYHPKLQGNVQANRAFFELLAVGFTRYLEQIPSRWHQVQLCVEQLMNDERFVQSLLKQPLSEENVLYRYNTWFTLLHNCVGGERDT